MACEVGLYYVLHITKQRNKNALLRLLPGLGESCWLYSPATCALSSAPFFLPSPSFTFNSQSSVSMSAHYFSRPFVHVCKAGLALFQRCQWVL